MEDKVDKTLNMADVVTAVGAILVGDINLVTQVHTVQSLPQLDTT